MSVYEAKAFVVHDNMPVVAKRVVQEKVGQHYAWQPSITLFYGGGEAENGAMGSPPCAVSVNNMEQLAVLKEAIEWAMLTHALHKLKE